jgi:hypothetical protein
MAAIDVSALTGFTGIPEGLGRSDLFTHDGRFAFRIDKAKEDKGEKAPFNTLLLLALSCLDDDNKGRGSIHNVTVSGLNKDNQPNVLNLGSLMKSAGASVEQVVALGRSGSIDLQALIPSLIGKTIYMETTSEVYQGKARTKTRWFIEKAAYEASQKAQDSSWRRPCDYLTAVAAGPSMAPGAPMNPAAAVAAFAPPSAPAGAPVGFGAPPAAQQNGAAPAATQSFFGGM